MSVRGPLFKRRAQTQAPSQLSRYGMRLGKSTSPCGPRTGKPAAADERSMNQTKDSGWTLSATRDGEHAGEFQLQAPGKCGAWLVGCLRRRGCKQKADDSLRGSPRPVPPHMAREPSTPSRTRAANTQGPFALLHSRLQGPPNHPWTSAPALPGPGLCRLRPKQDR